MPQIPMALAKTVDPEGWTGNLLIAVSKMEEISPPQMVPFIEALELTMISDFSIWLSGGSVAYHYCSQDHVLSSMADILKALCRIDITIHLQYRKVSNRAMIRTERRKII